MLKNRLANVDGGIFQQVTTLRELGTTSDLTTTSPILPWLWSRIGTEFSGHRKLPNLHHSWLLYLWQPMVKMRHSLHLCFTPWEGKGKWTMTFRKYLPSSKPWWRSTYTVRCYIFSIIVRREQCSGKLSNLPKVIEPISFSIRIETQLSPQSHMLSWEDSLVLIMFILEISVTMLLHSLWQPVNSRPYCS